LYIQTPPGLTSLNALALHRVQGIHIVIERDEIGVCHTAGFNSQFFLKLLQNNISGNFRVESLEIRVDLPSDAVS
jgi:hypothetical protein